jgi:hypothetical protein
MKAYILIMTEQGQAVNVTRRVSEIAGVVRADTVLNNFDVIAYAVTDNMDELAALVSKVESVDGIIRRLVCWR